MSLLLKTLALILSNLRPEELSVGVIFKFKNNDINAKNNNIGNISETQNIFDVYDTKNNTAEIQNPGTNTWNKLQENPVVPNWTRHDRFPSTSNNIKKGNKIQYNPYSLSNILNYNDSDWSYRQNIENDPSSPKQFIEEKITSVVDIPDLKNFNTSHDNPVSSNPQKEENLSNWPNKKDFLDSITKYVNDLVDPVTENRIYDSLVKEDNPLNWPRYGILRDPHSNVHNADFPENIRNNTKSALTGPSEKQILPYWPDSTFEGKAHSNSNVSAFSHKNVDKNCNCTLNITHKRQNKPIGSKRDTFLASPNPKTNVKAFSGNPNKDDSDPRKNETLANSTNDSFPSTTNLRGLVFSQFLKNYSSQNWSGHERISNYWPNKKKFLGSTLPDIENVSYSINKSNDTSQTSTDLEKLENRSNDGVTDILKSNIKDKQFSGNLESYPNSIWNDSHKMEKLININDISHLRIKPQKFENSSSFHANESFLETTTINTNNIVYPRIEHSNNDNSDPSYLQKEENLSNWPHKEIILGIKISNVMDLAHPTDNSYNYDTLGSKNEQKVINLPSRPKKEDLPKIIIINVNDLANQRNRDNNNDYYVSSDAKNKKREFSWPQKGRHTGDLKTLTYKNYQNDKPKCNSPQKKTRKPISTYQSHSKGFPSKSSQIMKVGNSNSSLKWKAPNRNGQGKYRSSSNPNVNSGPLFGLSSVNSEWKDYEIIGNRPNFAFLDTNIESRDQSRNNDKKHSVSWAKYTRAHSLNDHNWDNQGTLIGNLDKYLNKTSCNEIICHRDTASNYRQVPSQKNNQFYKKSIPNKNFQQQYNTLSISTDLHNMISRLDSPFNKISKSNNRAKSSDPVTNSDSPDLNSTNMNETIQTMQRMFTYKKNRQCEDPHMKPLIIKFVPLKLNPANKSSVDNYIAAKRNGHQRESDYFSAKNDVARSPVSNIQTVNSKNSKSINLPDNNAKQSNFKSIRLINPKSKKPIRPNSISPETTRIMPSVTNQYNVMRNQGLNFHLPFSPIITYTGIPYTNGQLINPRKVGQLYSKNNKITSSKIISPIIPRLEDTNFIRPKWISKIGTGNSPILLNRDIPKCNYKINLDISTSPTSQNFEITDKSGTFVDKKGANLFLKNKNANIESRHEISPTTAEDDNKDIKNSSNKPFDSKIPKTVMQDDNRLNNKIKHSGQNINSLPSYEVLRILLSKKGFHKEIPTCVLEYLTLNKNSIHQLVHILE